MSDEMQDAIDSATTWVGIHTLIAVALFIVYIESGGAWWAPYVVVAAMVASVCAGTHAGTAKTLDDAEKAIHRFAAKRDDDDLR